MQQRARPSEATIYEFGNECLLVCPRCSARAVVLDRGAEADCDSSTLCIRTEVERDSTPFSEWPSHAVRWLRGRACRRLAYLHVPGRCRMPRLLCFLALNASSLLAGCQHTPMDTEPLMPDTVIADGVEYTAALQDRGDSLRVVVTLRDLEEDPTEVVIGECVVTLAAYRSPPRLTDSPVWDGREGVLCPDAANLYSLAPGELREIMSTLPKSRLRTERRSLPPGAYYFAARIAVDPEPLWVRAGRAAIPR